MENTPNLFKLESFGEVGKEEEMVLKKDSIQLSSFGLYIKELREAKLLYQRDLSDLINKSQTWINFLEKGNLKKIEIQTLVNLSQALDVPVDELLINMGLIEKPFKAYNVEPRLAKALTDYPKDKQLALAKFITK